VRRFEGLVREADQEGHSVVTVTPFHVRLRSGATRYGDDMADKKAWREVLDAEAQRWSSMSSDELLSELHEVQAYEVERDSGKHQVEVELIENTDTYIHVMIAVDDGHLPASLSPVTTTFIRPKLPSAG
jgi:hypothetical protein